MSLIPGEGVVAKGGLYLGKTAMAAVPFVVKTFKSSDHLLPVLDATGKVHGKLPLVKDFNKYTIESLEILYDQLKHSVQKRIKVTSRLGRDRGHGQRQGAEQDLIKALEKYLNI